jgi:AbrB family looped-hinge helix DNA binding protein
MLMTSRISRKSQITIPKKIRETLGAAPGDLIAYEFVGGIVTLRRVDKLATAYHAALSQTLDEWSSADDHETFRDL